MKYSLNRIYIESLMNINKISHRMEMCICFFFYFPQILTAVSKLKIMSEVAHDNWKMEKTINKFLIKETTALNVSTERLINNGSWQPVSVRYRVQLSLHLGLSRRNNESRGMHTMWLSLGWLKSVIFSNSYCLILLPSVLLQLLCHDNKTGFVCAVKLLVIFQS